MQEGKTIGQLMEEMRQKAGAQNYHGHDYMDRSGICSRPALRRRGLDTGRLRLRFCRESRQRRSWCRVWACCSA